MLRFIKIFKEEIATLNRQTLSEKLHQRNISDKNLIPADGEIYHF